MIHKVALKKLENITGSPLNWKNDDLKTITPQIKNILEIIQFDRHSIEQKSVLIKPNLVRPHRNRPASFTDPRLILALIDILIEMNPKTIEIGENPGFEYSSRNAFSEIGLASALKQRDVKIRFFDEEKWVECDNNKGRLFRNVKIAESVMESDILINCPKMKTHMLTGVSLGVKNMLGIIPDSQRQIFHRNDIAEKVVDINTLRSPDLTVIDGLWAMEGQAPFHGDTVENYNVIAAGKNVAAVDSVTCQVMGFRPEEIPHIQLAAKRLFKPDDDIQIIGHDIQMIKRFFKRPVLSSTAQFEGINCIECGVCRGCLSAIRHSLDWLKETGELKELPEFTIVSGRAMPNQNTLETWQGHLILFGNCASEFQFYDSERRQNATWIPGCAPHVLDLAKFLKKELKD